MRPRSTAIPRVFLVHAADSDHSRFHRSAHFCQPFDSLRRAEFLLRRGLEDRPEKNIVNLATIGLPRFFQAVAGDPDCELSRRVSSAAPPNHIAGRYRFAPQMHALCPGNQRHIQPVIDYYPRGTFRSRASFGCQFHGLLRKSKQFPRR